MSEYTMKFTNVFCLAFTLTVFGPKVLNRADPCSDLRLTSGSTNIWWVANRLWWLDWLYFKVTTPCQESSSNSTFLGIATHEEFFNTVKTIHKIMFWSFLLCYFSSFNEVVNTWLFWFFFLYSITSFKANMFFPTLAVQQLQWWETNSVGLLVY